MDYTLQKTKVIGVDISRDITSLAIIDTRANIFARHNFNSSCYNEIGEFVDVLCEEITKLIEENNCFEEIRSIGISVSSGNFKTGCIENAPNLYWKGVVPLASMLSDRLGIAVALGNDTHAAALGESIYGCAHGMKDFLIIALGHGLGSALFSGGKIHLGSHGYAGELGHTTIVPGGRTCGCGKQGCLEAYCAEKGIIETARTLLAESDKPSLMRDLLYIDPKEIYKCCEQGDELAIETFRRTGEYLGLGLANIAGIFDPEAIIITGGISNASHWLLDPTIETFNRNLFRNLEGKIKILLSTMKDKDRDMLGASALAWEVKDYSLFV